jgi:hypothetical protein
MSYKLLTAWPLIAGITMAGILQFAAHAQPAIPTKSAQVGTSRHRPNRLPKRAGEYYSVVWGIDLLNVKAVESGELIRFSYRILDPVKAGILNDKNIEAVLISPAARARLVIPSLEKVGQLRQSNSPEEGRSYWMAFSNPRRTVKRGDHVNIDIGQFHVSGIVVE